MTKINISWKELEKDTTKLIKRVKKLKLKPKKTAIIAIARGGMAPAMLLSYALGIRSIFTVTSRVYDAYEKKDAEQEIENLFSVDFETYDNFIVVDDILDTSTTMTGVLYALEEICSSLGEDALFIPAVVYAQGTKEELQDEGITYGKALKDNPWVVFPYDHLSKEFKNGD